MNSSSLPPFDRMTYETDKAGFLPHYQRLFASLRDCEVRLLELGVNRGGSLYLWRDWFPRGTIVGLDKGDVNLKDDTGRIRVYRGLQEDRALLQRIVAEQAPDGFDAIIDDCSHLSALARESFRYLFRHGLKPDGLYVIEDWGTGFMPDWPDGAVRTDPPPPGGHTAGMVGFVKELVDHIPGKAVFPAGAKFGIESIEFRRGMAVVRKAGKPLA